MQRRLSTAKMINVKSLKNENVRKIHSCVQVQLAEDRQSRSGSLMASQSLRTISVVPSRWPSPYTNGWTALVFSGRQYCSHIPDAALGTLALKKKSYDDRL